ncbi:AbrB family transcriptional regulator [Xylophilus sp. GOD-11R]|uniref:AbrB family transcriptional regulator n=1 Tax=Xylophilus sp. GOD-11R TaxID=3089814 RepID=UPI00298D3113|nr:AbrB family transcriptional regulator [Xylophilus sp. GOD-11R]WPB56444.1 AbrB family transcriptional regulator [Xylophilus sp. GOD-11R]
MGRSVRVLHLAAWALRLVLVLAVSFGGGWVAHAVGVPLGWLLGSLVASAALAQMGLSVNIEPIRPYVLIFLGLALGQTFNQQVLLSLAGSLPAIVLCAMLTVAAGLVGAQVFSRFGGLDARTAFFCGTPGGVVLMAIHAREAGVSEQQVVLAQTIRLILVVLVYPALVALLSAHEIHGPSGHAFAPAAALSQQGSPGLLMLWWLAGLGAAFLGKKIGIPNPWMLAPCLLTAAFASSGVAPEHVPAEWIVIAQGVLGISLGSAMTRQFIRGSHRLVLASVLSSVVLSVILILLGLAAAWLFHLPVAGSLLGMAPGGMPEMAVTAQALQVSVPLVLAFHFVRVVFSNLLLEPVWRCARALRLV